MLLHYILIGVLSISAGLFFKYVKTSPNLFFGYRSPRSLKSPENWRYANSLMAKYAIIVGLFSTIAGVVWWQLNLNPADIALVTVGLLVISVASVEFHLARKHS